LKNERQRMSLSHFNSLLPWGCVNSFLLLMKGLFSVFFFSLFHTKEFVEG
jgi:hypothetical protein